MRVTRGLSSHVRALRRRAIGGAAVLSFARAIVDRHVQCCAVITPVDCAIRQPRTLAGDAHQFHHHDYKLALRFDVRLVRQVRERFSARPFLARHTIAARPPHAAPGARTNLRNLIERIFARERRIESTTTIREMLARVVAERGVAEERPAAACPVRRPAPAIEMVVRRPIAPTPPEATASVPVRVKPQTDDWSAGPARPRAFAAATPIPLTPTEIGRLTDQVVSAIDQRFVAYRERRGEI
jgi:hypothetical protein